MSLIPALDAFYVVIFCLILNYTGMATCMSRGRDVKENNCSISELLVEFL